MNERAIVMSVALFAVIVIGMFIFTAIKKEELQSTGDVPKATTTVPSPEVAFASITRIDAKHFFDGALHTFVGEIPFATPCELLEGEARVAESFPEQITLAFTVVNESDSCAQVVTNQRFKIEVSASKDAAVKAVFMGREVELNLIPPALGESPDDFELFIKG